jgi:hypothetical protein
MTGSTPKRTRSTGFAIGLFIAVLVIVIVMVIVASSLSGQKYSVKGTATHVQTSSVPNGASGY